MSRDRTGVPTGTQQRTFKYSAFISYKRKDKDERWAEWLQKKLESYRIPRYVRKRKPHLPKDLKPICRDETDFGLGDLPEEMQEKLRQSHYLIVVCSPRGAQSPYIDSEVQYFIKLGREDSIIPFIVEGEPDSRAPERRCYPRALRPDILGASVKGSGKHRAFARIVATMLEVEFDEVWKRLRRALWRKRAVIALGLVLVAIPCAMYLNWALPKVSYYEDYVTRWGEPEGIKRLEKSDVAHREKSWKFISQYGKIISVTCVNGTEQCILPAELDEIQRRSHQKLSYRARSLLDDILRYAFPKSYRPTGDLEIVEISAANGKFLFKSKWDQIYSDSSGKQSVHVEYKDSTGGKPIFIIDDTAGLGANPFEDMNPVKRRDNIGGVPKNRIIYDSGGFIHKEIYLDQNGNPTTDKNNIFGRQYERDNEGRVTAIEFLDRHAHCCVEDFLGILRIEYKYDKNGRLSQTNYLGAGRKPVLNINRVSKVISIYSRDGNLMEESYLGMDSSPCLNKNGVAKCKYRYGDKGNRVEEAYFGVDGKPCFNKYAVSMERYDYDKRGNKKKVTFFGVDGRPCFSKNEVSTIIAKYDYERGSSNEGLWSYNPVELSYFGLDGRACLPKVRCARATLTYDKRGNKKEVKYFGVDNEPCLNVHGVARCTFEYDQLGRTAEASYFGVDYKPCLNKNGIAKSTYTYDKRGNMEEESYYGLDYIRCLGNYGVGRCTYKYDERGNKQEVRFSGVGGEPRLNVHGVAQVKYERDLRDNPTQETYFGVDGEPCSNKYDVALTTYRYDLWSNKIESRYFDLGGTPCPDSNGVSKYSYKYDERDNVIEVTHFGTNGRHCLDANRVAIYRYEYDERGNQITSSCFGVNTKPCLNKHGLATLVTKYDERDRMIEQSTLGADGVICSDLNGVAIHKYNYDERGNQVATFFFGVDRQPCLNKYGDASLAIKYDERGRISEISSLGADGKPRKTKDMR